MNRQSLTIVILGLSITSSWGNGHATTYRSLVRQLNARGHRVTFLERDVPWYRGHRDLPDPSFCQLALYSSLEDLKERFQAHITIADLVIVGSYVPEGAVVGQWVTDCAGGVTAFYDIDTPVTLAALEGDACEYITRSLIPRYDLYLSFAGGPTLERLEQRFGSPCARPLYCSVDPEAYHPLELPPCWDLGYLGTYSVDRQPRLERLLLEPARRSPEQRFVVAGPQYPADLAWPPNVERIDHLPPVEHRTFYNRQRFTLNVTRADMIASGWSPSVRLFEAAACGTPIISDSWPGLDELLTPGKEILLAENSAQVVEILHELPEQERLGLGQRARARILDSHTAAHRALELETAFMEVSGTTVRI